MRAFLALLFASLTVTSCTTPQTLEPAAYRNPVLDADFPDPTVIRAADGLYYVYVAHLRQTKNKPPQPPSIVRVSTPPIIDGRLDEWKTIPAIASNTREQFLRGVGQWKGPDVDSHSVQLSWDDTNLYLAVSVRAPQHQLD